MKFERIERADHPAFDQAFRLYEESFPIHEQRTREKQEAVLSNPDYHCQVILENGRFVGILLCWEAEEFCYVEHFAIDPRLRGEGWGSRVLEQWQQRGRPLLLEIDPPVDEVSVRRKHFYEKLGFQANPWPHIHPPYRPGFSGHELVIMTYPGAWDQERCGRFQRYLAQTVMADCRDVQ